MDISERILQFRYHIAAALAFSLAAFALLKVAPRFLDVLAYFWPLLLSTALFLALVLVFGRFSPPPPDDKAGEGIIDYVAGQHSQVASDDTSSFKFD